MPLISWRSFIFFLNDDAAGRKVVVVTKVEDQPLSARVLKPEESVAGSEKGESV